MTNWLRSLLRFRDTRPTRIPDALWQQAVAQYAFLASTTEADPSTLRALTGQFLAQKQFSGAHGLVVTDEMAVAIAAQACLPVLHLGLKLYDDFKGIVVHPGAMLARRSVIDAAGVHHFYKEELVGEAMEGGPVTLSWQDAAASREHQARGYNVVIHEFGHKIDMRDGAANGCPPLASRDAKTLWQATMQTAYDAFREQVVIAERFGGPPPWLDAYAAASPAEFFAVTSEAYFVNPARFKADFPSLQPLFDAFYSPKK
ncbi:MAG: zinc-dependent peptidase [Polaromonas sp.]